MADVIQVAYPCNICIGIYDHIGSYFHVHIGSYPKDEHIHVTHPLQHWIIWDLYTFLLRGCQRYQDHFGGAHNVFRFRESVEIVAEAPANVVDAK